MLKRLTCLAWVCTLTAVPVCAQTRPASLATIFEDIYGPSGLVVSSDTVTVDGTNHAAHFNSAFQSDFRLVNIALASQIAAVPLPSPASGFTYRFDPGTGTFVRSTSSFGPILTERGETIGRGRIAFGFDYQFFSFDHLDGVSLTDVPAVFTHDSYQLGGGRADVIHTRNTVEADVSQFSGALTFGLTDRVDVALAVPIVATHLSLLSNAKIYRVGTGAETDIHYFPSDTGVGGHGDTKQFFAEGSAAGVGDIAVRVKGTLMREHDRALAIGVDTRIPSGDEQNLLGAGAAGVRGFAAFSSTFGRFAPHANVGYQWNGRSVLAGDVRTNQKGNLPDQFGWAFGSDFGVRDRLTLVADLLGQRVIDSPQIATYAFTAVGPAETVTLPDVKFSTGSYWTTQGALGLKANVAGRLLLNVNLRFHLAGKGLTDRVTPLVGLEWTF
jgi:hypothetical protein